MECINSKPKIGLIWSFFFTQKNYGNDKDYLLFDFLVQNGEETVGEWLEKYLER